MPDPDANLPAVPADGMIEGMVFDGEVIDGVIDDAPPVRRFIPAPGPLRPHVTWLARQGTYVAAGVVVAARRRHEHKHRHRQMMRAARAAGDHESALKWEQAYVADRKESRENRESVIETIVALARTAKTIGIVSVIVLAVAGVAVAYSERSLAGLAWPVITVLRLVKLAIDVATVAWTAGPPVIFAGTVAWLHHLGRHAGDLAPRWLATSADPDADVSIDETTIARALEALRIAQVRDYLKEGLPLQYLTPARRDGRGTHAVIRLPAGVTAERIARRRADLATGLFRQAKEVWPSTGTEAGILDLWVADKGALEEGAGPYPLLSDGLCDLFRGVPFGRTLRGDPVTAPLMERNTLAGGMPGQGKSSAARVIMCGAALDPTAELWILIPDTNFDFEAMKRRCARYVMGAEDEKVELIRDWLRDLREEVQRRGQLLVDHEIPAVSRKLASAGVGLHPLMVLLEEAHVAITHKQYGKEIAGLLTDIVKLGRKRAIHVIVSTQAPTRDSMPRDVTRNCSNGIAFAVGDHVANDALLGQGAYAGGHRATELIPGTDRGTALVKGFSGERSEMVQVYFVDVAQVPPIIDRALAEIARAGRELPGSIGPLLAIERRSLLDDLAEVTTEDEDRPRVADLPARLRGIAPHWDGYKELTGVQLRHILDEEGVRVVTKANVPRLDVDDLRRVLAEREEEG